MGGEVGDDRVHVSLGSQMVYLGSLRTPSGSPVEDPSESRGCDSSSFSLRPKDTDLPFRPEQSSTPGRTDTVTLPSTRPTGS